MQRILVFLLILLVHRPGYAQSTGSIRLSIRDEEHHPIPGATAALLRNSDSALVTLAVSDRDGLVHLDVHFGGEYRLRISSSGFATYYTPLLMFSGNPSLHLEPVVLHKADATMENLIVSSRRQLVELRPGKTIVNLDAGITNAGTSALEALEKMPGITVDKDGNLALKGRSGVLVLIDGKQTYLGAAELSTMLRSMSSSEIHQVELISQPSARFDAAGSSGVINIRTKKNWQRGFNGNISTAAGQGFYPKTFNSLQLNYRSGKFNYFLNYGFNANQQFNRIYALRRYFEPAGQTVASFLEQPTFIRTSGTSHNLRMGIDYNWSKKTTVGMALAGTDISRSGYGNNNAAWINRFKQVDSVIETKSNTPSQFDNASINLNMRHQFNPKHELTADIDLLNYRILNLQEFENIRVFPNPYREALRAEMPSSINIIAAKADYTAQLKNVKLETGWKSSSIQTDNDASHQFRRGNSWEEDLEKSNRFLYSEKIHAFYGHAQTKKDKWDVRAGLRYEVTRYDARQLGNAAQKDSSFSRAYDGLFPNLLVSFEADSNHHFNISAGRRIDRPAFQKLNPFLLTINKYTYQQGNAFYQPQYTWNMALEHQYKNMISTSLGYSITTDYFSQIFPIKENGIVIYTEGNLDKLQVWSASVGMQLSPAKWWSLNGQAVYNYKKMEGFIGRTIKADINQVTLNLNNQFRFGNDWSGEITGVFASRSQHDIQEIVDPSGQLSIGLARRILHNQGTLKLAFRDILYTQWVKGNTNFQQADEFFKLTRDTRVAMLTFTYRFGKASKPNKRSEGGAGDEKARVGSGG